MREQHDKPRAAGRWSLMAERAAVTFDPAGGDGQAEPGSKMHLVATTPGHEGLEQPGLDLTRDAATVVLHGNAKALPQSLSVDC
jgi:hypothetical protein